MLDRVLLRELVLAELLPNGGLSSYDLDLAMGFTVGVAVGPKSHGESDKARVARTWKSGIF